MKQYREKLKGHTVAPPTELWGTLERELANISTAPKVRILPLWLSVAAIALLLLLTGVSLFIFEQEEVVQVNQQTLLTTVAEPTVVKESPMLPIDSSELNAPAPKPLLVHKHKVLSAINDEVKEVYPPQTQAENLYEKEAVDSTPQPQERERRLFGNTVIAPSRSSKYASIPHKKRENSLWSVRLSGSNQVLGYSSQESGFGSLIVSKNREQQQLPELGLSGTPSNVVASTTSNELRMVAQQNINQEVITTVNHATPITLALTLQRDLTPQFSLESGLTYTQLNTQLQSGGESNYIQTQTLHYVGIPLKAQWNFLHYNRIGVYLSAGAMLEKCIKADLTTTYNIKYEGLSHEKEELEVNTLQLSTHGAVGVQYQISQPIALFVEPGVVYYFQSTPPVSTLYQTRTFNMSLQLGLRFDL